MVTRVAGGVLGIPTVWFIAAMVTRVARGHSVRPLSTDAWVWLLFWTLHSAVLARLGAVTGSRRATDLEGRAALVDCGGRLGAVPLALIGRALVDDGSG